MAEENVGVKNAMQGVYLDTSAQKVVDDFAREAKFARDLLEVFKEDKIKVLLYVDGTYSLPSKSDPSKKIVSETKLEILEYAFPNPEHPNELPPTLNGFGFEDLHKLLQEISWYLHNSGARLVFAEDNPPTWTERQRNIQFGSNVNYPASFGEVNETIDNALHLVEYVISYSSDEVRDLAKESAPQAPPIAAAVTKDLDLDGSAIVPPDSERQRLEDEKQEDGNEKKEEEEENKKPDQPRNFIQEIASGDAAFHKEVVRMEVMLANQLAAFYGINEKDLPNFTEQFTQYIAPHLFFELQKLSPADLRDALKSAKGRSNIYLSALLRMQHDPAFRARLTVFLKNPTAKPNKKDAEPTAKEIADTLQYQAKDLATAIAQKAEEQEQALGEAEIENIVKVHGTKTSSLAEELRSILGREGAGLAESDINNILVRLQTFAITRRNIHQLTPEQYRNVFGEVFGSQNAIVFDRIQLYFNQSDLDWTRLFSAYVEASSREIYAKTKNPAALSKRIEDQVPGSVENNIHQTVFNYGPAAATSLYSPRVVLEQRKKELEDSGLAGTESAEYHEITNALGLKEENLAQLERLANLNPLQQQHVFRSLGFTSTVYQEMHLTEIRSFLLTFQTETVEIGGAADEVAGGAVASTAAVQFLDFIYPPEFLTADTSTGEYNPGEETSQWQQYAMASGAKPKGDGKLIVAGMDVDRMLGKASLALITSGASVPIVEKIEKIQGIIGKIPGGDKLNELIDKYGWKSIDMIGKAIRWLLSFALLKAVIDAIALIAGIIAGVKLGMALASVLQGAAAKLVAGIQSLIGRAGAGIAKLAGGIGSAVSGLTASGISALQALAAATPFSGAVLGGVAVSVMGYTVFFSSNVNDAFLTDVTGGSSVTNTNYADGVGNRGCWPSSGRINVLDQYGFPGCIPTPLNNYCAHGVTGQCINGLSGRPVCGVAPGNRGQAVDIAAVAGTPVYAPFPGKATFYGRTSGLCYTRLGIRICSYGNHVILKSNLEGRDVVFIFAHLRDFGNFAEGVVDRDVQVGDVIGTVDNTGNSDGNHLHYEVLGTSRESIFPERVVIDQQVISQCSAGGAQI